MPRIAANRVVLELPNRYFRRNAERWFEIVPNDNDDPRTPDGRYLVVRGRLWRLSNPSLEPAQRELLVRELMAARRAVRAAEPNARARVDAAKRALGERGPVWWSDGAPDYNRHLAKNTPYAGWYATLSTPASEPRT